jgi:hypothetical protein
MKVKFKFGIETYSGTVDGMTYGSYRDDKLCIGREYVYPTITANNNDKGAMVQNLAKVYQAADPDYIADLKAYCVRNGMENVPKDKLVPTAFSMFLKMMYAWYESDPAHVDLKTVTVADIVALDADVRTIARAVTAEFLPYVSTADSYTNGIQ